MNPKIKKIVAREGLVIIIILFAAGLLYWFSTQIPDSNPKYLYKCVAYGHTYEVKLADYINNDNETGKALEAIDQTYPGVLKRNKNKDWLDIPPDFSTQFMREEYGFKSKIKNSISNISAFLLFLLYPLYLLTRFIIWAVKTLRVKNH